jgi:hypothetical protein
MAKDTANILLRESYETFRRYANLHLAKGTKEGNEKAAANNKMANRIEKFLATQPIEEGSEASTEKKRTPRRAKVAKRDVGDLV